MYHLTTSSTIPYLYITQSFQSALFLISTSPGHTNVSPYYQQYQSISVHHSVLPISPLSHLTSPGHTSVSPYYQQYHSVSVHHSVLPISPLSHLHITRPYQYITLLPAVPFCICTSLSSSNQPSFSSPLHQAIPVYHPTTSSTIPYLYITQLFQSALFLISTSPGHTSVSPYYQQYHSISVHHSVLPISPLSHLHITRPYQCITLLPAVPFHICTSLSPFNQPSFSSPHHQAIPVYHLTTSSTIPYLYITQFFQSALFHHLHITRPYQCITLLPAVPFHISTSLSSFSHFSHLHFTRPYQCIILLPAVPFHICTSLSPSNQPSFSSPHHQAIPVYHLTTSSTIPYLYITQSFQSAPFLISISPCHTSSTILYLYITQSFQSTLILISTSSGHTSVSPYYQQYHSVSVHYSALPISPLSHLHITMPYQCITLLPAVPFHICTSLSPSNQPSFSSPHHQAIPVYHLTTSSTILYLYITQLFQPSFSSKLHQAIPVYHFTTSSTIPYLYITQSFQSTLFLISTSPGHTSVSPYYQQYNSVSVHHSALSALFLI